MQTKGEDSSTFSCTCEKCMELLIFYRLVFFAIRCTHLERSTALVSMLFISDLKCIVERWCLMDEHNILYHTINHLHPEESGTVSPISCSSVGFVL